MNQRGRTSREGRSGERREGRSGERWDARLHERIRATRSRETRDRDDDAHDAHPNDPHPNDPRPLDAHPHDGADGASLPAPASPPPAVSDRLGAGDRRALSAERIEASHALARAWERAVVELAFESAGRPVRIDTERTDAERTDVEPADAARDGGRDGARDEAADLATVHGTVGEGQFAVELPAPLLAGLVAGLPDAPDPLALSAADAALVLEHALTDGIEAVERALGEPIRIESVEDGPLVTELQPFTLAAWADKRRHLARAVVGDALHMRILAEWLGDRAAADEFEAGPATRVEIGPIVLSPVDWAEIEVGDALAIGTEPGSNLKGRLVRPTGRTLPVEIDTSHVIAAGPLAESAPPVPDGALHLGVAIGTVRLTPTHLARATRGARFIMERNAQNSCELMRGETVVARGALTLIEGQLGVEIHALGDGLNDVDGGSGGSHANDGADDGAPPLSPPLSPPRARAS